MNRVASGLGLLVMVVGTPALGAPCERERKDVASSASWFESAPARTVTWTAAGVVVGLARVALADCLGRGPTGRRVLEHSADVLGVVADGGPKGSKAAEARYLLGTVEHRLRRPSDALKTFRVLLKQYPRSRHVPDALTHVADIHYERQAYALADAQYATLQKRFPATYHAEYAAYRRVWCDYRRGARGTAMNAFQQLAQVTRSVELLARIQSDLVTLFADMGAPSVAAAFFKRWVPDRPVPLLKQLADTYVERGRFRASDQVLQQLIGLAGTLAPQHTASWFRRLMVRNALSLEDLELAVERLEVLARTCRADQRKASPEVRKTHAKKLERLLSHVGRALVRHDRRGILTRRFEKTVAVLSKVSRRF